MLVPSAATAPDKVPEDVVTTHDDLAAVVVRRTLKQMAAGKLQPTLRDGLAAQQLLDRRAEKAADRSFMLNLALALAGGGQRYPRNCCQPALRALRRDRRRVHRGKPRSCPPSVGLSPGGGPQLTPNAPVRASMDAMCALKPPSKRRLTPHPSSSGLFASRPGPWKVGYHLLRRAFPWCHPPSGAGRVRERRSDARSERMATQILRYRPCCGQPGGQDPR